MVRSRERQSQEVVGIYEKSSSAGATQESAAKKVLSTPVTQHNGQCEEFVAVALVNGVVLRTVATFVRGPDIDGPRSLV